MISMDRKIATKDSAVNKRMIEYSQDLGELHIVIFSRADENLPTQKIAPNVWIYPTNSIHRAFYIFDAIRIGKKILAQMYFGETLITADDPYGTGITGVILKTLYKLPLQIQIHTDVWSSRYRFASILNWVRVFIAPHVLQYANGIRVVSEKIRDDVVSFAKINKSIISVLPVFVDVLSYKNTEITKDLHVEYSQWKTIILMSSRLTKEKDISLALTVMKKLVERYPDVGMVIVGSGPEEMNLRQLVQRFELGSHVIFEGWQDDLISYFRTADIFLNTSQYEGYGMTLVEAGASGCSIVTTRVGIVYGMLRDGKSALICNVGDESCLYTKLVTLIENPTIRKSLGSEVQRDILASALSHEEYLKKTQFLFTELSKKQ